MKRKQHPLLEMKARDVLHMLLVDFLKDAPMWPETEDAIRRLSTGLDSLQPATAFYVAMRLLHGVMDRNDFKEAFDEPYQTH